MCDAAPSGRKRGRADQLVFQLELGTEQLPIYLDHNATTPVSDVAWEAILECQSIWGNPSSSHLYGVAARNRVDAARKAVADALGTVDMNEIFFTSGGTEANNTAIIGVAKAQRAADPARNHIVSSTVEHPAVTEVLEYLKNELGFEISLVPVNPSTGCVDPSAVFRAVRPGKTAVVTIMHANNENGAIHPIAEIAKLLRQFDDKDGKRLIPFHTDASQSLGKIPADVNALDVDLLTVCSHKFYGPKGVGALYVRTGTPIVRTTYGAKHERGLRPGTENIILVSGMAAALTDAVTNLSSTIEHVSAMRQKLIAGLTTHLKKKGCELLINNNLDFSLPNTLSCSVRNIAKRKFVSSAQLIADITPDVAASAGSACHSSEPGQPPHVSESLKALGLSPDRALGTLRLSTGKLSTAVDMARAARVIANAAADQFKGFDEDDE